LWGKKLIQHGWERWKESEKGQAGDASATDDIEMAELRRGGNIRINTTGFVAGSFKPSNKTGVVLWALRVSLSLGRHLGSNPGGSGYHTAKRKRSKGLNEKGFGNGKISSHLVLVVDKQIEVKTSDFIGNEKGSGVWFRRAGSKRDTIGELYGGFSSGKEKKKKMRLGVSRKPAYQALWGSWERAQA